MTRRNASRTVAASAALAALFFLFLEWTDFAGIVRGVAPVPTQNGDVNGDLNLDISDAVYLLDYLFSGGDPPIAIAAPVVEKCTLNVKDFGAVGDGSTDDTVALRRALAAAEPTGASICVPPGTYIVSGTLSFRSGTYLKGAGANSVLKRSDSGTDTIFFSEGVRDVTVESIAIDLNGAGPPPGMPLSFANGLAFRTGCSDIRIRDVRIYDSTGTNLCCRHGILVMESTRVWIERNHLSDGMRIKAGGIGDMLVIENNVLEKPNDNAITIATAAADAVTTNYIIRGNIVRESRGTYIYVGDDGFDVRGFPAGTEESGIVYRNILVEGNLLSGAVGRGQVMIIVRLANVTERLHVTGNVLENTSARESFTVGISVSIQTPFGRRGADFLIADNTVTGEFEQAGIWVRSVDGLRVVNNQISNVPSNGIRITSVDSAALQGNMVRNCARGMLFQGESGRVQVIGNSVTGSRLEGISIQRLLPEDSLSLSALFMGNTITHNLGAGIRETGPGALDTHYVSNDLRDNAGGPLAGINDDATLVGNLGTADRIYRHIAAGGDWDPPALAHASATSMSLTARGARVGDTVSVGFGQPLPPGVLVSGSVVADDSVAVTLLNMTGGAIDPSMGVVAVDVWRH